MTSSNTATPPPHDKLLFVYGTLKRGGRLHHFMNDGCQFLCEDTISHCHLYQIAFYPGAIKVAAAADNAIIKGEVYQITTDALAVMDEVEGEGTLYKREVRRTQEHGHHAWIYMYLGEVDPDSRIVSGVFDVTYNDSDDGEVDTVNSSDEDDSDHEGS